MKSFQKSTHLVRFFSIFFTFMLACDTELGKGKAAIVTNGPISKSTHSVRFFSIFFAFRLSVCVTQNYAKERPPLLLTFPLCKIISKSTHLVNFFFYLFRFHAFNVQDTKLCKGKAAIVTNFATLGNCFIHSQRTWSIFFPFFFVSQLL